MPTLAGNPSSLPPSPPPNPRPLLTSTDAPSAPSAPSPHDRLSSKTRLSPSMLSWPPPPPARPTVRAVAARAARAAVVGAITATRWRRSMLRLSRSHGSHKAARRRCDHPLPAPFSLSPPPSLPLPARPALSLLFSSPPVPLLNPTPAAPAFKPWVSQGSEAEVPFCFPHLLRASQVRPPAQVQQPGLTHPAVC